MLICGQGLSVFPDLAQFLVEPGIDPISVTPDPLLKTKRAIAEVALPSPRPWRKKMKISERMQSLLQTLGLVVRVPNDFALGLNQCITTAVITAIVGSIDQNT